MVLKVLFVLSAVLVFWGCERVPDWERKSILSKDFADFKKWNEMRKWVWTCRGVVPNYVSDKDQQWLGKDVENFLDRFRSRGLSSIDTTSAKTILGSVFLWDDYGHLLTFLPWIQNVHSVECSNGGPWISAKLKGYDHATDFLVLQLDIAQKGAIKKVGRWVERSTDLNPEENLYVVSMIQPGQLDRLPVKLQAAKGEFFTGLDSHLRLFLPSPSSLSAGGVLVDEKAHPAGFVLTSTGQNLWGVAMGMSWVKDAFDSILKTGKVIRPYTGLKLKFSPDEGFVVQQIDVGSPAYQAGLRVQDKIKMWDGSKLTDLQDWTELSPSDIHRQVTLTYERGAKQIEAQLKVAAAE